MQTIYLLRFLLKNWLYFLIVQVTTCNEKRFCSVSEDQLSAQTVQVPYPLPLAIAPFAIFVLHEYVSHHGRRLPS